MRFTGISAFVKKRKRLFLIVLGLELLLLSSVFILKPFKPTEQLLTAAALPLVKPELTISITDDGVVFSLTPLRGQFDPQEEAKLTLSTVAGPYTTWHKLEPQGSSFLVPYVRAGKTPYSLSLGTHSFSGTLERLPGEAVTPLEPLLTARSARVTKEDMPAVIVQPLDQNGNVSTSSVRLRVINPDKQVAQTELSVTSLYSWAYLPRSRLAGKQYIIAETDTATGERAELDLLPGEVARSDFQAPVAEAPASGRDTWSLRLNLPRDLLVNRITDGTNVLFYGEGEGLDFFVTRPLNQGESNLVLPTYPQAEVFSLRAQSGNYISDTVTLVASALTQDIPYSWLSTQPLTLELGPVIDSYGAIPDTGSEVKIDILDDNNELISQLINPLSGGKALIVFPPLPAEASQLVFRMAGELIHLDLPEMQVNVLETVP
ncbi:MAG: hypothetical protein KC422_10055 [Trueperaceae bacterium]|nr:hypothetical protein [Trueperaceae bacterium]